MARARLYLKIEITNKHGKTNLLIVGGTFTQITMLQITVNTSQASAVRFHTTIELFLKVGTDRI
jgi:hypothetical protein